MSFKNMQKKEIDFFQKFTLEYPLILFALEWRATHVENFLFQIMQHFLNFKYI